MNAMAPAEDAATRLRVLFVAEAVTLAHVGRLARLTEVIDPARHELHFAQCPRYRGLLGELACQEHVIDSIEPAQFTEALARGAPLYDTDTLRDYLAADRALLSSVRPDVVVSDFRLTMPLAARLENLPCLTLGNACWSPFVQQRHLVPDLPLSRALGATLAQPVFALARPLAFAAHCRPMRRLFREQGLAPPPYRLGEIYSAGDLVLYADLPGLYTMAPLPDNHRFIGPVTWSPAQAEPAWWNDLPADRPLVYVTIGSSGDAALLPAIVEGLRSLDVTVMVSTAGSGAVPGDAANVYAAPYLPGEAAAARADLVVCNGGSPTTHQALQAGRPVLGIAGNMDQHLNMQTLENAGAGQRLRSDALSATGVRGAAERLLREPGYRRAAARLAEQVGAWQGPERFRAILDDPGAPWARAGSTRGATSHA